MAILAVCLSSVLTVLGALAPPTLALLGPPMAALRGVEREVRPIHRGRRACRSCDRSHDSHMSTDLARLYRLPLVCVSRWTCWVDLRLGERTVSYDCSHEHHMT